MPASNGCFAGWPAVWSESCPNLARILPYILTLAQVSLKVPRLLCQHQMVVLPVGLPSGPNLARILPYILTLAQVSLKVPRLLCQHQMVVLPVGLPSGPNLAIYIDTICISSIAGIVEWYVENQSACVFLKSLQ